MYMKTSHLVHRKNVTQIAHRNAWKLIPPALQLQIAMCQQALLQLDFCDKDFYFKGFLIHNRIRWSKVLPYHNKGKKIIQFISIIWWRHLCYSIIYFLELSELKDVLHR